MFQINNSSCLSFLSKPPLLLSCPFLRWYRYNSLLTSCWAWLASAGRIPHTRALIPEGPKRLGSSSAKKPYPLHLIIFTERPPTLESWDVSVKTNIFRLFTFYLVCFSLEWFSIFIHSPKLRWWALHAAACFGRSFCDFSSPLCSCFQTPIASVSMASSRWQACWREQRAGCLCRHQAWVPPWEHCAGVTTCLVLTRSKLLCITSLSLLISLLSLQAVGFLSRGALPAIFLLLTMKSSIAGAIAMPVTFWCCSKMLSSSTSFWSRFHTSLARSDSCLRD